MRSITLATSVFVSLCALAPAVSAQSNLAIEAQLCRSQLDLLIRGNKLTESETLVFAAQCDCLALEAETAATDSSASHCAEDRAQ